MDGFVFTVSSVVPFTKIMAVYSMNIVPLCRGRWNTKLYVRFHSSGSNTESCGKLQVIFMVPWSISWPSFSTRSLRSDFIILLMHGGKFLCFSAVCIKSRLTVLKAFRISKLTNTVKGLELHASTIRSSFLGRPFWKSNFLLDRSDPGFIA